MKPTVLYLIQYYPSSKEWQTYDCSNSIRHARKMMKEFARDHDAQPWRIIRREITETVVEEPK